MVTLLLTIGCAPEALPTTPSEPPADQSCPFDGSQIGEPDCDYIRNHVRITLRSGGAPVDGTVRWTAVGCVAEDLDCAGGECSILDAVAADYEVTATVGDRSETLEVTLDEDDRVTCSDCCGGEALIEALIFEF